MRRPSISLVVVLVLGFVCAGARAANGSSPKPLVPASLLLTRADLGRGWSVEMPAPRSVPSVGCDVLHFKLHRGAAHPAAAATPTFRRSSSGPFMVQTAYEYATASEQRQVWKAVARRALLGCLAESFVHGSTAGVHFTVTSKRKLVAPKLRVKAAGYRVTATARRGDSQSANAYLDVILLATGTGLSELSFSSLLAPPAPALERRLSKTIASVLL